MSTLEEFVNFLNKDDSIAAAFKDKYNVPNEETLEKASSRIDVLMECEFPKSREGGSARCVLYLMQILVVLANLVKIQDKYPEGPSNPIAGMAVMEQMESMSSTAEKVKKDIESFARDKKFQGLLSKDLDELVRFNMKQSGEMFGWSDPYSSDFCLTDDVGDAASFKEIQKYFQTIKEVVGDPMGAFKMLTEKLEEGNFGSPVIRVGYEILLSSLALNTYFAEFKSGGDGKHLPKGLPKASEDIIRHHIEVFEKVKEDSELLEGLKNSPFSPDVMMRMAKVLYVEKLISNGRYVTAEKVINDVLKESTEVKFSTEMVGMMSQFWGQPTSDVRTMLEEMTNISAIHMTKNKIKPFCQILRNVDNAMKEQQFKKVEDIVNDILGKLRDEKKIATLKFMRLLVLCCNGKCDQILKECDEIEKVFPNNKRIGDILSFLKRLYGCNLGLSLMNGIFDIGFMDSDGAKKSEIFQLLKVLDFNVKIWGAEFLDFGRHYQAFDVKDEELRNSLSMKIIENGKDPVVILDVAQDYHFGKLCKSIRESSESIENAVKENKKKRGLDNDAIEALKQRIEKFLLVPVSDFFLGGSCVEFLRTMESEAHSVTFQIGEFMKNGDSRHCGLAMKLLCDKLDIPCRVKVEEKKSNITYICVINLTDQIFWVDFEKRVLQDCIHSDTLSCPYSLENCRNANLELESEDMVNSGKFGELFVGYVKNSETLEEDPIAFKRTKQFQYEDDIRGPIRREFSFLRLSSHPNIIPVYHLFSHEVKKKKKKVPRKGRRVRSVMKKKVEVSEEVVAMKFYDFNLTDFFENKNMDGFDGKAPVDCSSNKIHDILVIWTGIAKGLRYVHKMGIVHLDLKPQNILIMWDPDNNYVKEVVLCDFQGVKKLEVASNVLRGMTVLMTSADFDAPEVSQALNLNKKKKIYDDTVSDNEIHDAFRKISSKSDVYSFGMLLRHYRSHVSDNEVVYSFLNDVCQKCLSKDFNDRPKMINVLETLSTRIFEDVFEFKRDSLGSSAFWDSL